MTPSIVPIINCEQIASSVRTWIPKHFESRIDGPEVWVHTPNQWAERGEDPRPGAVCYLVYENRLFQNLVELDSPDLEAEWNQLLKKHGVWCEVINHFQAYLYCDRERAPGVPLSTPRSSTMAD